MTHSARDQVLESLLTLAKSPESEFERARLSIERGLTQIVSPERLQEIVNTEVPGLGLAFSQIVFMSVDAQSKEKFVEKIVDSMPSIAGFDSNDANVLRGRVAQILELGLGDKFKGFALSGEYERLFLSAAVYTDVRPIVLLGKKNQSSGYLVSHQLKIKFQQLGGERELYIAATDAELMSIVAEIQLALESAETLRNQLGSGVFGAEQKIIWSDGNE